MALGDLAHEGKPQAPALHVESAQSLEGTEHPFDFRYEVNETGSGLHFTRKDKQ